TKQQVAGQVRGCPPPECRVPSGLQFLELETAQTHDLLVEHLSVRHRRIDHHACMSKDLTENPGKEVLMITAEHAPGGSSAIHRHNAHAFVYVLEGSVVMQLKGGQQVTLTPGQKCCLAAN